MSQPRYKVNKNLILQKIDGKLVCFQIDRSHLYVFNDTAEFIFKKIKLKMSETKIAALLSKKYEISEETALKDTIQLIKKFQNNMILV